MKKIAVIIALISTSLIYSQGHFKGQKTISPNYLSIENGYGVNLNFQQLIGNNYFGYRIDINYSDRDYKLNIMDITKEVQYNTYSIGTGVSYSLENIIPHPLYIQPYLGLIYRYEVLNNNDNVIEGITYKKPNNSAFGAYYGIEAEFALLRKVSIVALIQNQITNSKISDNDLFLGLGLKLTIK